MPIAARIRVTTIVVALAIGGGLAGCSSGADTPSDRADAPAIGDETAAVATDPCSLLTIEQIDDATGWTLPEGERPDVELEGDRTVCNWEDLRVGGSVQVQVDPGAGRDGFDAETAQLAQAGYGDPVATEVAGASGAVELADAGILTMLVGDDVVQLAVFGADLDGVEHRGLAADVAEALR